jgi:ketosteroid isomerase-like protein
MEASMTAPTPDLAALTRLVQQHQDRIEIADLCAHYCYAIDGRDLDALCLLFTEHGTNSGRQGREEIRAFFTNRFNLWGTSFHSPLSHVITFQDTDHATGILTGYAEMQIEGEYWIAAARYTDVYVRNEGVWRFAKRSPKFHYYMRLSDFPEGFKGHYRRRYTEANGIHGGGIQIGHLPEELETYQAWIKAHPEAREGMA